MTSPPALSPLTSVVSEPAPPMLRRVVGLVEQLLRRTTRIDWRGAEHVVPGGVVIAANHLSYFDFATFAHFVVAAGRWPHFLAKESVFRIPVLGAVITACDQIPVHRGSSRSSDALQAAEQAVLDGKALLIYPEGTLTKDPQLWPMRGHSGAVRIALRTGCPIIPIAQWGPQQVIPPPRPGIPRLFPRATIRVLAGPPVDLSPYRDRPLTSALLTEATAVLMARITEQLAELRQEQPPTLR